jgi:stage V sporulation protein G
MTHTITEVTIEKIKKTGPLVAFATIIIDRDLYLSGIAIYERKEGSGYRVIFPTRQIGARRLEIVKPINRDMYIQIEQAVVTKYCESVAYDRHNYLVHT